jgi:hypothetical protein
MNVDTLGLYDIYDIYHVPFWHESWFLSCIVVSFCVVVFIFSLAASIIFYRKAQNVVIVDAWVELLQKMQSIRPSGHATFKDCQKFYDCLTQILKNCLQARYCLIPYGATDQEIYVSILCTDTCTSDVASILSILERGIAVKFAGDSGLHDQCENDYLLVHNFIVSTTQYSLNNK